jgi:hypothetical protein
VTGHYISGINQLSQLLLYMFVNLSANLWDTKLYEQVCKKVSFFCNHHPVVRIRNHYFSLLGTSLSTDATTLSVDITSIIRWRVHYLTDPLLIV